MSDRWACRPDHSSFPGRLRREQRGFPDDVCAGSWLPHAFQTNCRDSLLQANHAVPFVPGASLSFAFSGVYSCSTVIYNSRLMDLGLKNRVALIAASSQGIGFATAESFAAEGCRVAMCARNEKTLQDSAAKIRKQHNAEVFAEVCDVTAPEAVAHFVAAVADKFGGVDICVTNAGGPPAKGFLASTLEDWQRAVAANLLSTVYFTREVIPHMQKKHWGRIITITSITTKQPVADLVLSNSVRAAVVGLVKSAANALGRDGILVNNVGPGFT